MPTRARERGKRGLSPEGWTTAPNAATFPNGQGAQEVGFSPGNLLHLLCHSGSALLDVLRAAPALLFGLFQSLAVWEVSPVGCRPEKHHLGHHNRLSRRLEGPHRTCLRGSPQDITEINGDQVNNTYSPCKQMREMLAWHSLARAPLLGYTFLPTFLKQPKLSRYTEKPARFCRCQRRTRPDRIGSFNPLKMGGRVHGKDRTEIMVWGDQISIPPPDTGHPGWPPASHPAAPLTAELIAN